MLRKLIIPIATAVVAAGLLALAAVALVQSVTIREQATIISTLSANYDLLRDQVDELGEVPVAPPAETVVGQAGAVGPSGADGVSIVAVSCSSTGAWIVEYSTGRLQSVQGSCIGLDGADGQDGAASTIPGPTGATGPAGADGSPGTPGEPPTSWTFTWLAVDYTCTRTDPFDPASPTYQCTTA